MSALPSEFIAKSTELLTNGISVTELEAKVLAATAVACIDAGQINLPVGTDEIYANGEWDSRRSFNGALGSLVNKGLVAQDENGYGDVLYFPAAYEPEHEDVLEALIKQLAL